MSSVRFSREWIFHRTNLMLICYHSTNISGQPKHSRPTKQKKLAPSAKEMLKQMIYGSFEFFFLELFYKLFPICNNQMLEKKKRKKANDIKKYEIYRRAFFCSVWLDAIYPKSLAEPFQYILLCPFIIFIYLSCLFWPNSKFVFCLRWWWSKGKCMVVWIARNRGGFAKESAEFRVFK